jgi:four helix bundle protein
MIDDNDIAVVEESKFFYGDIKSFRDLIVWQKAMELVKEVYIITRDLPTEEKYGLTGQLRKSAVSVPSNIAEGWGRKSTGNYLQFLKISNGSLCEADTQLTLCVMLGFLNDEKTNRAKSLVEEVGKMLRSLINTIEKNKTN